jgi:dienelactone hydrolase
MKRGLDVLLAHEHADPSRVAVTGLSGGGWQTIFFSPLDTRVTLCDPVAGYSSFFTRIKYFSDLGDSEQTPCDLATVVDYSHLTAMMAPRPTLLTFNAKDDCCFAAPHALPPLLEAATPIFDLFGKGGNLRHHINEDPGTHNYERDNREALYRMLGDHFFADDPDYPREEIPSDDEVKPAEALAVELPESNLTLGGLAKRLAEDLPRPMEGDAGTRRERLGAIVRPIAGEVEAEAVGSSEGGELKAESWAIHVGPSWTVPAVALSPGEGEPKGTAILLADEGRASKPAAYRAEALLDEGWSVLAIDPFYLGEAKVEDKAYLFALMVGTVGERPLGVQAGQVMAAARWRTAEGGGPVRIVAEGPRTGLIALVAAALEPGAIAGVELHDGPTTLKEVIERGLVFADRPEAFCFGLLESFDVPQIEELVAPRPVAR